MTGVDKGGGANSFQNTTCKVVPNPRPWML